MRNDIIEYLETEIKHRCESESNFFGMGCYYYIHGAQMAEELLKSWDYDVDKIEMVKKCILNHRGSELQDKNSIEEICVADADAISHFDSVPSLFYLAYVNRKLGIEEGMEFVKNKLQRSFNKLSDRSKMIYKEKYDDSMKLFTN